MTVPTSSGKGAARRISLLVVDDHPIVRAGLRDLIADQPDLVIVAEAENGERAVARFRDVRPDVTLMDLRMPVMGGPDAIKRIRAEFPDARIIALTTYDGDADIRRALSAGARGYLLKDMLATEVVAAIRAVSRGERAIPVAVAVRLAEHPELDGLTPRELEVLEYIARGFGNRKIAEAIGRTDETVKLHVKNVFRKLNVESRTAAVSVALIRGLVHLP
jgi:DNA-binding NarL/FixJ family response regulator